MSSWTRRKLISRYNIFLLCLVARLSAGASCCSGTGVSSGLITGDDRLEVRLSLDHGTVIGDARGEGPAVFRSKRESEVTETLRLEAAILVTDRWQVGSTIPLVRHLISRPEQSDESTRLGDVRLGAGYEVLPEWTYSVWRPKGYLFTQWVLPTGRSLREEESGSGVTASGRGFHTIFLGILFLKRWSDFDASFTSEAHYSFRRTFDLQTESLSVASGFGTSLALGFGYSPGGSAFRIGGQVRPVYEGQRLVTSSVGETLTGPNFAWDSTIEMSYLFAENWSLTGSYMDQTILGPAIHSTLSRVFGVALQHRWPR